MRPFSPSGTFGDIDVHVSDAHQRDPMKNTVILLARYHFLPERVWHPNQAKILCQTSFKAFVVFSGCAQNPSLA